jgi:hypothetical protein
MRQQGKTFLNELLGKVEKQPVKLNRRQRRQKRGREFSNKKGAQIVVAGIFKYKKVFQRIGNKTIVHSILAHPITLKK